MKVYLDSARRTPKGWVRAYTCEGAIQFLKTGRVKEISVANNFGNQEEGYNVVQWIERQVRQTHFRPPMIWIRDANPTAEHAMRSLVDAVEAMAEHKGTEREGVFD